MATKIEVVAELRHMLKDVFAASAAGTPPARIARAHGYVDGYMRALLDVGVLARAELLDVVSHERRFAGDDASGDEKRDETAAA